MYIKKTKHSGAQVWIGNQAYLGVYFENELKYKEANYQGLCKLVGAL